MVSLSRFIGKKTVITLIFLFLLIVGAGIYLFLNLENLINNNKDMIITKLEDNLGRDISVQGFDVSLWPGVNLQLTQFTIADNPAFYEGSVVEADALNIHFSLLPLLRNKIEISRLVLDKPEIYLRQNEKGEWNYSGLISSTTKSEEKTPQEPAPQKEQGMDLSLTEFQVKDGLLVYSPMEKKKEVRVQSIDMTVSDFSMNEAFPVQGKAALQSEKQNIVWDGKVGPLQTQDKPLQFNGEVDLKELNPQSLIASFDMQSSLPKELSMEGPLSATIQFDGSLNELTLKSEWNAKQLALQYGDLFEKKSGVSLNLKNEVVISNFNLIQIKSSTLNLGDTQFTGNGKIQLDKSDLQYNFMVDSKEASLDDLSTMIAFLKQNKTSGDAAIHFEVDKKQDRPVYQGEITLNQAQFTVSNLPNPISDLNGSFYVDTKMFNTENVQFTIGDTSFQVKAKTRTFTPMTLDVDITSPSLKVADIAKLDTETQKPNVLESFSADAMLTFTSGIRAMGEFNSGKGTFYDLDYTNLNGRYEYEEKILNIPELTFEAYSGTIQGNAVYNMQKEAPEFDITTNIKNLDIFGVISSAFMEVPESIKGLLNLSLNIKGSGNKWDTIRQTLTGNANLQIQDGVLMNTNVVQNVLDRLNQIPMISQTFMADAKQQYPSLFESNKTLFKNLVLDTSIENGLVDIQKLLVEAAEWMVEGQGQMKLGGKEGLKSDAFLRLSDGFSNFITQEVKEFQYLTNQEGRVTIPFSMTGALANLKTQVNEKLIQNILQKALVNKGMDTILKEVGAEGADSPASRFSNILKSLGGQGKKQPSQDAPNIKTVTQEASKRQIPKATEAIQKATKSIPSSTKPADAVKNVIQGLFK